MSMSGTDEGNSLCMMYGCQELRTANSYYCNEHTVKKLQEPERMESVYDHIKINIEQSAKGVRCTVTLDRSDHNIDEAIRQAVATYRGTLYALKSESIKVDES